MSMSRYKVLLTDYAWEDVDVERQLLHDVDAELVVAERTDTDSLIALAKDADAIMTCWAPVPRAVIEAAGKCRIIARLGIGIDNIDVAAASERNIVVTNVPDYCLTEVAEHTLALMLALGRNIAFYHHAAKEGIYDLSAKGPPRRIEGQTLGIVGFGRIGRTLAGKAAALGLRPLASDPAYAGNVEGVSLVPLDELLSKSDYISLHVPLIPETRHLIGAAQFALMKTTAFLINTARGGLVDHAALAEALEENKIAGAALDVHEPEPPDLSMPPWIDPRVIVTPHAAFMSIESLLELRTRASRQVADLLTGREPENIVNRPL